MVGLVMRVTRTGRRWLALVVAVVMLALAAGAARAEPSGPIRIAIECEGFSRTKACPTFLLGFVDANKVLLSAPRASAEVVVYAATTQVALVDKTRLRFVST